MSKREFIGINRITDIFRLIKAQLDNKQDASTAITTSNIGMQSVAYAEVSSSCTGSSGTAAQVVGSDNLTTLTSHPTNGGWLSIGMKQNAGEVDMYGSDGIVNIQTSVNDVVHAVQWSSDLDLDLDTVVTSNNIGEQSVSYANSSGSCTGNSATATKATKDGSGNTITSTYATKTELGNKQDASTAITTSNIGSQTVSKAGSCTGNSATATALTSKSIGSSTQPVYFDANGKPVACTAYASASVNKADKATKDGNGVNIASTYIKYKTIDFGQKQLTTNQVNTFTYTKTGGTIVGAFIKQCWPVSTWTNAVCSIVQATTDGSVSLTTMASQKYSLIITFAYI